MLSDADLVELEKLRRSAYGPDAGDGLDESQQKRLHDLERRRVEPAAPREAPLPSGPDGVTHVPDPVPDALASAHGRTRSRILVTVGALLLAGTTFIGGAALERPSHVSQSSNAFVRDAMPWVERSWERVTAAVEWDDAATLVPLYSSESFTAWSGTTSEKQLDCVAIDDGAKTELQCLSTEPSSYPHHFVSYITTGPDEGRVVFTTDRDGSRSTVTSSQNRGIEF
jgi:hypothetical protein